VGVPRDGAGQSVYPLEISPLFALEAEDLAGKIPPGLVIDGSLYLGPEA